jgi:hypothetical protein
MTPLPPHAVNKFAAAMNTVMRQRIDKFEILDAVILLIAVPMMDVMAVGDRAVMLFPDNPMYSLSIAGDVSLFIPVPHFYPHWSAIASAIPL